MHTNANGGKLGMQDTGIVRRIDELGRVVIPKEIRRTLRIREGDPLEIYTNKDELVFKKYSPIVSINSYAEVVAEGLSELTEKICLITDTDAVVYVSGTKGKDLIGKDISSDMEKTLKDRKSVVLNKSDSGRIISPIRGDDMEAENQIIVPIVSGGDCYGSVVMIDREKSNRFSSTDVKLVRLGATFLSRQFE